jgi:hypothetical protein
VSSQSKPLKGNSALKNVLPRISCRFPESEVAILKMLFHARTEIKDANRNILRK